MTWSDVIERNALLYPQQVAVIFEGHRYSHSQFAALVRRSAQALAAMGVNRGSRVAILAKNSPEYLALYLAAGLAGFTAVGINYRLSVAEQADILTDCEPQVFFFDAEHAPAAAALMPQLPTSLPRICLDAAMAGCSSWADLLAAASQAPPAERARSDDTLLMIYTSGTTGRPKGVMLSNEGMFETAREYALAQGARPTDRMLVVMPFYHIGGPGQLLTYFIMGATIVLHRQFDPSRILQSIEDEQVSAAHFAPTMIQMLLDEQERQPRQVRSLQTVCYASAPMSVALSKRARAAFGEIFVQIYGMTEQGIGTMLHKHQHFDEGTPEQVGRLASAGQAFLGTEIKIVRDDGSACAAMESGEICTRSKGLMQGYWRKPEATAQAIEDGWMRTGDVGYLDPEGYLFVQDRKKDMIISGGENIYSREVEEALLLHPSVLEAAVIGVPDPKWGETVKAFVAFKSGTSASPEALQAHCRGLIAAYKCPRSVEVMAALPRIVSTQKIDKRTLRAPYWPAGGRQVA
jgi:acyl-CoA synthetase (AMP-forming)/AMP-acid ligase II